MADEEVKVIGIQIPGEQIPGEQKTDTPTVEQVASSMGWDADKEKYEQRSNGKPWVDAATFLRREHEFTGSIRNQLENVKGTIAGIKQHFDRQLEVERKKMKVEMDGLKKARRDAIENADVDEVERLDHEIETAQKELNAPEFPSIAPEVKTWQEKNSWYTSDIRLQRKADAIALMAERNGKTLPDILKEVDDLMSDEVKTFQAKTRIKEPDGAVETEVNNRRSGTHMSYSDLPTMYQKICDTFVNQKLMTRDQYIKQLEEQGVIQ